MRHRSLLTVTFALALASGCAPIAYRTTCLAGPPRSFDAVAVYPFELEFPHRYPEAYGKTDDLVQALRERGGDVVIVGPEEFEVMDPAASPSVGSTLGDRVRALGFAPERVAVLRARARRREHTQRLLVKDFHEKPVGYLSLWYAVYRITLELVTADGVVLARTEGEAWEERKDLADAPAQERYPKLREAIPRMLRDLQAGAAPVVRVARRPVRSDVRVLDTHRRLMRHPEVEIALPRDGTVERDVAELVRYEYFDSSLPAAWLPTLRAAGDGVVVLEARGAAAASGLRPGDVVTTADGRSVRGVASFDRALAAGASRLAVMRGGRPVVVALAPPCSLPGRATVVAAAGVPGRP